MEVNISMHEPDGRGHRMLIEEKEKDGYLCTSCRAENFVDLVRRARQATKEEKDEFALWDAEDLRQLRRTPFPTIVGRGRVVSGAVKLRKSTMEDQRVSNTFVTQLSEDDPYDTDLEDDEDEIRKRRKPDDVDRAFHEALCQRMTVPTISYYLRHAHDSTICMRHRGMAEKQARAICGPLTLNPDLTSVDFTGNSIGDTGSFTIFATFLFDNPILSEVNLSCNNLKTEGAKHLRTVLHNNQSLMKLDISNNLFKDKDACIIADVIRNCKGLKDLNLSNNEFSIQGAVCLASVLASNSTIRYLDLSWNQIRLKGADAIGEMLEKNRTIKRLNISMNGFSVSGSLHIAAALTQNDTLEFLDISNNRIPEAICTPFAKLFVKNVTLKSLNLSSNPINTEGAVTIVEILSDIENLGLEKIIISDIPVNEKFLGLEEDIKQKFPNFRAHYGYVTKGKDAAKAPAGAKFGDQNPLELLLMFMSEQRLRLVDLFKSLDKDQSMSLTRDEFIDGLKQIETPLSEAQLNELINMLDKDGDGEVDLSEILNINQEFKDVKAKALKKQKEASSQQSSVGQYMGAAVKALSILNALKPNKPK